MTLVGIAGGGLGVDVAFGAAAAALVGDDDRLLGQLVLGDDRLNDAGEIVGAAAGADVTTNSIGLVGCQALRSADDPANSGGACRGDRKCCFNIRFHSLCLD